MAKTKPNVKAHAKKSVTTNAIFKTAGKKALRQERTCHTKDAIEKPTKASKSSKEYKPKHTTKHIPEHPLAAEFACKIRLIQYLYLHSKIKVRQAALSTHVRRSKRKPLLFSTRRISPCRNAWLTPTIFSTKERKMSSRSTI